VHEHVQAHAGGEAAGAACGTARRCARRDLADRRLSAQATALFCWCQSDAAKTLAKTTCGRYRLALESGGWGWATFGPRVPL